MIIENSLQCETPDGKRYELINNEWVPVDGSGAINPFTWTILLLLVLLFRLKTSYFLTAKNRLV